MKGVFAGMSDDDDDDDSMHYGRHGVLSTGLSY